MNNLEVTVMANTLVQFRTEEKELQEAAEICEKLGMSLQVYLRMCITRLVQKQGVPFSMRLTQKTENPGESTTEKRKPPVQKP